MEVIIRNPKTRDRCIMQNSLKMPYNMMSAFHSSIPLRSSYIDLNAI